MPPRRSKRLVIDASVARAAGGEEATFPRSKYCRDFLKATLDICHRAVMTPEISEEWKPHRSNFARKWLVEMYGRRKVQYIKAVVDRDLRGRIEHVAACKTDKERDARRKDFLLIEAAVATDRTVISLDDIARTLFARAAHTIAN